MKVWLANWSLRLLSLFLAFVLWFVVSGPRREPVSERAFAAPLSLLRMPRNLVITTPVPDTVSVRLRGRVSDLRAVSSQNLEVPLDLAAAQPGNATVTLLPRAINVQPQIEVMSIDPNQLHFRIEQIRQKVVPIRPFLVGEPPGGYAIGDVTMSPDHALVSGPASQIRNISEVATERIIMTGRTETFVQNVAVVSDSALIRIIDPLTAEVTVPLTAEIGPAEPSTKGTTTIGEKKSKKKKTP
jgi:YbbR domain-containing protein